MVSFKQLKVLILANKKPYGTVIFTVMGLQLLPAAFNTIKVAQNSSVRLPIRLHVSHTANIILGNHN